MRKLVSILVFVILVIVLPGSFLSAARDNLGVYIICGLIILALMAGFIIWLARKEKRRR